MDSAMTSVGMSWLIVRWWWHNKNESRMGEGARVPTQTGTMAQQTRKDIGHSKITIAASLLEFQQTCRFGELRPAVNCNL